MKKLLLISFGLLFLFSRAHAAEIKAAAAHATVAEAADAPETLAPTPTDATATIDKKDATYFALLKSVFKKSTCIAPYCLEPKNCTDCLHTAQNLISILIAPDNLWNRYFVIRNAMLKGNQVFMDFSREAYISYDYFLDSNLLDSFLQYSREPEHSLLLVALDHSKDPNEKNIRHALVIEKKGDGKNTYWRIYQSYSPLYSLSAWLDDNFIIENWDDPRLTHHQNAYNKFGHGKILNQEQVKEFLEYIHTTIQKKGNGYYMKKITMPYNINEILAKQLAAAASSPSGNAAL